MISSSDDDPGLPSEPRPPDWLADMHAARDDRRRDPSAYGGRGAPATLLEGAGLYTLLVESVRDYAIFALDPAGYVLSWNLGAERLKGYRGDEIIGRHFSTFYPAEDIAAGKTEMELEVASREGRFEDEGWRVRKDGTLFWANVIITALRDASGTLVGFAKVTRDLSERKRNEERAIADASRLAAAEAASRAKSEFLATLSHELRTPLNAIAGYAELMKLEVGGPVAARHREFLERISSSQQHLLGIIDDLLSYSRLDAGRVHYAIGAVRVDPLVEHVLPMILPQAAGKRIDLAWGGRAPDAVAQADEHKVEQIILNLLSNAVKFTPAGGTIRIFSEQEGDEVRIGVSDSGPGIAEDRHAMVFEPFVQLGRTLAHPQEGTGLGLAISRDLARGMGGDIALTSREGDGATFVLRLPRASAEP